MVIIIAIAIVLVIAILIIIVKISCHQHQKKSHSIEEGPVLLHNQIPGDYHDNVQDANEADDDDNDLP